MKLTTSKAVSEFPSACFNDAEPLLPESWIMHLHLLSETQILVFLLQESKMYAFGKAYWKFCHNSFVSLS